MEALYDRAGNVVAFLTETRFVSLQGVSLAWLDASGNVYDYDGRHLGWWRHGHMRGHDGGVVAWRRGATGVGLPLPPTRLPPPAPRREMEPPRHTPAMPPQQPGGKNAWSSQTFVTEPAG